MQTQSDPRAPVDLTLPGAANVGSEKWTGEPDTDLSNAHRLAGLYKDKLVFVEGMGFYHYDSGVWAPKSEDALRTHAQARLAERIYLETSRIANAAADAGTPSERKAAAELVERLTKHGRRAESKHAIDAALSLAKSLLHVPPAQLDADPALLNVANGVIHLPTQTLQPHHPKHLMTRQTAAPFDPDARHWAVDAILGLLREDGREAYLRRALGSSLYGAVINELVHLFIGGGATGKSTLTEGVLATLGTYGATIDARSILESRNNTPGGARADIIALLGKRFGVTPEPPKGSRYNATDIKAWSSGDQITARQPYSTTPISFRPIANLVIVSNFDPAADWDDPGLQRRLVRVPFNAKPPKPDPRVKQALLHNEQAKSAILNWLLAGIAEWFASDHQLEPPEIVSRATREFWHDMDPFAEWAETRLDFGRGRVTTADVYADYKVWCDHEGERPRTRQALGKWLSTQPGLEKDDTRTSRGWKGLRLRGPTG